MEHKCELLDKLHDCQEIKIRVNESGIWELETYTTTDGCGLYIVYCPFCGEKL